MNISGLEASNPNEGVRTHAAYVMGMGMGMESTRVLMCS